MQYIDSTPPGWESYEEVDNFSQTGYKQIKHVKAKLAKEKLLACVPYLANINFVDQYNTLIIN